jgi:hypothetical protein
MDGILTYTGVSVFGSSQAEGNPLVKSLIDFYGLGPGLTLAKGFGCFFLVLLYNILKELVEVSLITVFSLYSVLCFYLFAVFGWIYILIFVL